MSIFQTLIDIFQGLPQFRGKTRLLKIVTYFSRNTSVKSAYGPLMKARLYDFTNWAAVVGAYGSRIYDCVLTLQPGDCFIDVGANAGIWSLVAAQRVGSEGVVIAFEPQRVLADEVRANATLNGLSNILVFDFGIGKQTGHFSLKPGNKNHTGITYVDTGQPGSTLIVAPHRDFRLLETLIGGRTTIVKIDTEGAEFDVLEGLANVLALPNVNTVIVEIDESLLIRFGRTRSDVYRILEGHGFEPTVEFAGIPPKLGHYDEIFVRRIITNA